MTPFPDAEGEALPFGLDEGSYEAYGAAVVEGGYNVGGSEVYPPTS